jgi:hypothetical protein
LGEVVGSLHLDNLDLIPALGTAIEILIIALSFKLTISRALLKLHLADKVPNLLWVMHVTWIDGVAERRGVGQILESALEDAVD